MKSEDVKPPETLRNVFAELENYFQKSNLPEPGLLWFSIPLYLNQYVLERQTKSWDKKSAIQFLNYLQTRPPVWLRLNDQKFIDTVKTDLKENNLKILENRIQDNNIALAIEGQKGIYELESYKRGLFEIQDFASQQIGLSVKVQPSQFVWDTCAGGGGNQYK